MGITSSTGVNTRNKEEPPFSDRPDPMKASFEEGLKKDIHALFPPKPGTDQPKDDIEREEEAEARFCEFMKGGACKDAFMAVEDCTEEFGYNNRKCKELSLKVFKCMYSHPDYYQPVRDRNCSTKVNQGARDELVREGNKRF